MYTYLSLSLSLYIYIYIYTHTYIHTYIHTHIHMYAAAPSQRAGRPGEDDAAPDIAPGAHRAGAPLLIH